MKNNIFYLSFLLYLFLNFNLSAQELEINSTKIRYNNKDQTTIFEGNVSSKDAKNNIIYSEYIEHDKVNDLIESKGKTRLLTSAGYEVLSSNLIFDNKKKLIHSDYKTKIIDKNGNRILVDMFRYSISSGIFFSKGNISVLDISDNNYNFSEIYIDESKQKIIGSDVKAFLNQDDLSANINNEPRFFANTMSSNKNISTFEKGVFTYCKIREGDKCPPWELQSKKIKHDLAKKTIYYEDVVLKIYDFPIFYSPIFSHPDPTVKRQSGLLAPALSSSTTVGSGFSIPYFWNIAGDKDLTLTPKLYLNENPLFLAEYRQDFSNSSLIVDSGYTSGYKKLNKKKTDGGRAHFFSKFSLDLIDETTKKSKLEFNLQKVSNGTYFKIHDIDTLLVDKNKNILDNSTEFTYQNKDFYFSLKPSAYEDINKIGNSRYEYLLPLTIEKNLLTSNKLGLFDLATDLKIRNYEVNKQSNILVNNFKWKSNKWLSKLGFENHFEGIAKAVNYDAKNTKEFKNDSVNSELNPALGYFAKLRLYKNDIFNKNFHTLTPKFLLRYAPGHMRNIEGGRLNYANLFSLNKVNQTDVVESGLSTSIGFEYKKNKLDKKNNIGEEILSFAVGQVISSKENFDIPSSTSLDQRVSDLVGTSSFNISEKINLNYNFSLDQGYKEFNYNEVETELTYNAAKFNVSYLQEKNHIGNQEFVRSGVDFKLTNSTEFNITTKRNLLTNSAEFYNLSYNYINDCLKAGIAYRREFYTDRDIEPVNNLMFTISIVPFAQINSPGLR